MHDESLLEALGTWMHSFGLRIGSAPTSRPISARPFLDKAARAVLRAATSIADIARQVVNVFMRHCHDYSQTPQI